MPIGVKGKQSHKDCYRTRSGLTAVVVCTMVYASACLVIGILCGIIYIGNGSSDTNSQHQLQVAFGVAIVWCLLQLFVTVLCLGGTCLKDKQLLVPFVVVKLLSFVFNFVGALVILSDFPSHENAHFNHVKLLGASVVSSVIFASVEVTCGKFLVKSYGKIDWDIQGVNDVRGSEEGTGKTKDDRKF